MSDFDLKIRGEELAKTTANGGDPLLRLCQKEADRFSEFLQNFAVNSKNDADRVFMHGLSDWEKKAVVGYLYQKTRGRI